METVYLSCDEEEEDSGHSDASSSLTPPPETSDVIGQVMEDLTLAEGVAVELAQRFGLRQLLDPQVSKMLRKLNLQDLSNIFMDEDLSMTDLAEMNTQDLKEIGISSHKRRKSIINEVKKIIHLDPEINEILSVLSLQELTNVFVDPNISFIELVGMSSKDLLDAGIKRFKDRKAILGEVEKKIRWLDPNLDMKIGEMLRNTNLQVYDKIFVRENFTFQDLETLTLDNFEEIGISNEDDREAMFAEVRRMVAADQAELERALASERAELQRTMKRRGLGGAAKLLVSTSSSRVAEQLGHALGMFEEAGQYNHAPYYQQLSSCGHGAFLYKTGPKYEGVWLLSAALGSGQAWLVSSSAPGLLTPPTQGWLLASPLAEDSKELAGEAEDAGLSLVAVAPGGEDSHLCGAVTLASADPQYGGCLGLYLPTGRYSAGRAVFRSEDGARRLFVPHDASGWVLVSCGGEGGAGPEGGVRLGGGALVSEGAPCMCPACPEVGGWRGLHQGAGKEEVLVTEEWVDITITCSDHC